MPCDANRLLKQRFRGHGDDVARAAQATWEDPETDVEGLRAQLEPPVDARVWLSAWPSLALASRAWSAAAAWAPAGGEPLPPPSAPIFRTLARLHAIDPVSNLLCLDGMRGALEAATWRSALGINDAVLAHQIAVALFRALVIFADVLQRVEPVDARACLQARWLEPSASSEVAALGRAREMLANPSLSMTSFRVLVQQGGLFAITLLASDRRLSVLFGADAARAFRRALRIEPDGEEIPSFEEPLFAFLGRELAEAGCRTPDGHLGGDALVTFALGKPSEAESLAVVEHLACCRDDRCFAVVRAEVTGAASVRRMLAGPMSVPSSWPAQPVAGGPMSPHMIRCRDVLWETFTTMAQSEGRTVDELVDEAMDGYRQLRTRVGKGTEASPKGEAPAAEPSWPAPAGGSTGSPRNEPPPSSDDEEDTLPRGSRT
jgi:hypothetical protein